MGTRSRIGVERADGTVQSIYCHWDGYPSGNGQLLVDNYTDPAKVDELIALGSLSSLGRVIGVKHDFDKSNEGEARNMCTAYGRDRGETDVGADTDTDAGAMFARASEGWEEYAYLFRDGVWLVAEDGGGAGPFLGRGEIGLNWQTVTDVLAAEAVASAEAAE